MPGEYRRSFLDRLGPDGGTILKSAGSSLYVLPIAYIAASLSLRDRIGTLGCLLVAIVAWVVVAGLMLALGSAAGAGFKSFVQPSGASTPYEHQFSYQAALAARGDVAGALASYESLIAADPHAVEARIRAAELYATEGADPARAAELFREVQRVPGVPAAREVYASNRLVDLYRGPLGDEGRALVELRRLAERHPGTRDAEHARAAIAKMKGKRDQS